MYCLFWSASVHKSQHFHSSPSSKQSRIDRWMNFVEQLRYLIIWIGASLIYLICFAHSFRRFTCPLISCISIIFWLLGIFQTFPRSVLMHYLKGISFSLHNQSYLSILNVKKHFNLNIKKHFKIFLSLLLHSF